MITAVPSSSQGFVRRFSQSPTRCSTSIGHISQAIRLPSVRTVSTTPIRLGQEAAAMALPEPEDPGQPVAGPDEFWRRVPIWKDVNVDQFMSWEWNVSMICPRWSI
jgi:hypothetical protein